MEESSSDSKNQVLIHIEEGVVRRRVHQTQRQIVA
jgi:hypothetical protein